MAGLLPPQPQGNQSLNLEALYQQWAQANPNVDPQISQQAFMAGADAVLGTGGETEVAMEEIPMEAMPVDEPLPIDQPIDQPSGGMMNQSNWRNFEVDVSDVQPGGPQG